MRIDYTDIFNRRGNRYDAAMEAFPDARNGEYDALFHDAPVKPGEQLIDMPAGGGYLKKRLPLDVLYYPLEITAGFGHGDIPVIDWDDKWPVAPGDHVVCMACLHHFDDHEAAIEKLLANTAPGGIVHIADVARETGITKFLDGFVGAWNETGHDGNYLSADRARAPLGQHAVRWEIVDCPWTFASEHDAAAFAMNLFGLSGVTAEQVLEALDRDVGMTKTADSVCINWRLLYGDYRRAG